MAENNIIVNTTKNILINCEMICELIHRQNYYYSSKLLNQTISLLGKFIDSCSSVVSEDIMGELISIFKEISETQATNNIVLLGDILQLKLVPLVGELQKFFLADADIVDDYFSGNVDCLDEPLKTKLLGNRASSAFCGYNVEYTNIGALTLCGEKGNNNIYFHSNGDPYKEARYFADEYSDDEYLEYVVLGMGLGYHIKALLECDQRYRVVVLELNLDVLTLACIYTDFTEYLKTNRLEIKYIDHVDGIASYVLSEKYKFIVHYPSLIMMDEGPMKAAINEYFVNLSSMQAHRKELAANFYFNQKLGDASIDAIKDVFYNKTVIYVGGGPSVQLRLNEIVELRRKEDSVFICAGTVYLKLIQSDVIPDYVIITDPAPGLVRQIVGSNSNGASMLYLSTASKDAVAAFKDIRYVLYQNGYEEAEKVAKENDYTLFETGGSVSTTAIDIALRFGCKKLVCVGLDLAFTNNQRHAFGIGGSVDTETNLLSVEAVEGGRINTSNNLNMYRKWIEQRIANVENVELVNMSRGAKIHGMKDE